MRTRLPWSPVRSLTVASGGSDLLVVVLGVAGLGQVGDDPLGDVEVVLRRRRSPGRASARPRRRPCRPGSRGRGPGRCRGCTARREVWIGARRSAASVVLAGAEEGGGAPFGVGEGLGGLGVAVRLVEPAALLVGGPEPVGEAVGAGAVRAGATSEARASRAPQRSVVPRRNQRRTRSAGGEGEEPAVVLEAALRRRRRGRGWRRGRAGRRGRRRRRCVAGTVATSARRDQSAISAPPPSGATISAARALPPAGKAAMSAGSMPSVTKRIEPGGVLVGEEALGEGERGRGACGPASGMIVGSSASRKGRSTVGSSVSGMTRCAVPA